MTKLRTAWPTWDSQTMCFYSPHRWRNYVICYVTSKQARKKWDWEFTQTRRRYSAIKTTRKKRKSQLTTSRLKSWDKVTAQDILDKRSRSKIRKQRRSRTDWRQRGQRSTNIDRSWPQKVIDCATDFAFSIWSSLLRWPMQVAHGLSRRSMKKWSKQRDERCFAFSYRQKGNTRRKGGLQVTK